ncbi:MAG TPA: T9SS type A sorting domain-containing protein, partial [Rhodothermales bacterium]|nr:T9SS type A sorting domain-containing protein [Rhodothermales bacterium]
IDIAVGAPLDDDGADHLTSDRGAVWILFLRPDGTTRPERKISSVQGGLAGSLDDDDYFGTAIANLPVLQSDGTTLVAVGAPGDDDGAEDAGAVWLLSFDQGTVTSYKKLSLLEGNLPQSIDQDDGFGTSICSLGDLDADGNVDIAVGAPGDDDGAEDAGALWILYLDGNGRVKSHTKVSNANNDFAGVLRAGDAFGSSVAAIGDIDGDGATELVVGAPGNDDAGASSGAIWILSLRADGSVREHSKISRNLGGFTGDVKPQDRFGVAVTSIGDFDNNGVPDLAVAAPGQGALSPGSVWLLHMDSDLTVKESREISNTAEGFVGAFDTSGPLAKSLLGALDVDGSGVNDLVVGAPASPPSTGAVWVILLRPDGTPRSIQGHSGTDGDFMGMLALETNFGAATTTLGDLNGDGITDLAVGAPMDNDGGFRRGAIWISYNALIGPPLIDEVRIDPEIPRPGDNLLVSVRMVAPGGLTNPTISFRSSGETEFLTAPLRPVDANRYGLRIPAFVTGSRGVEFFLSAENVHGQPTRYPPSGISSLPVLLPGGVTLPVVSGSAADAYRLYSVPLHLEERSALAMIEDDLGPLDRKEWRFYGYNRELRRHELDAGDMKLVPGAAFWLLVRGSGRSVHSGTGTTVSTAQPFQIPLAPGWNYVGNPYNFSLPLSNVRLKSGQTPDFRTYEGSWSTLQNAIESLKAYAVFNGNATSDTLVIDPDLSAQPVELVQARVDKATTQEEWSILISAVSGRAHDNDNIAAVSTEASLAWDVLDRPEPPVIGDYVSVYFPHTDWDGPSNRFSTDARPPAADGHRWAFEVTTHLPGIVTLTFEDFESVPEEYGIWLVDDVNHVQQDLRMNSRYFVASKSGQESVQLTLLVGTEAFVNEAASSVNKLPTRFELFQNYPNPFSSVTTIRYGLAAEETVNLAVYNVLGEAVATLVNDVRQAPGYHVVVWDGRGSGRMPLGAGVYFLRIGAGRFTDTRPVMIVK